MFGPRHRKCSLTRVIFAIGGLTLCAILGVTGRASAEVKTLVLLQDGEMCPYMRPLLTPQKGWTEEPSTCRERLTILVPEGTRLGKGPAAIYGRATANTENLSVETFVQNSQSRWKESVPNARITPLGEVARANGQGRFLLFRYDNPSRPKQPVEFGAFTIDTDDKGNSYRVMVMLTASSEAALKKVETAYRAVLATY